MLLPTAVRGGSTRHVGRRRRSAFLPATVSFRQWRKHLHFEMNFRSRRQSRRFLLVSSNRGYRASCGRSLILLLPSRRVRPPRSASRARANSNFRDVLSNRARESSPSTFRLSTSLTPALPPVPRGSAAARQWVDGALPLISRTKARDRCRSLWLSDRSSSAK